MLPTAAAVRNSPRSNCIELDRFACQLFGGPVLLYPSFLPIRCRLGNHVADVDMGPRQLDVRLEIIGVELQYLLQLRDGLLGFKLAIQAIDVFVELGDFGGFRPAATGFAALAVGAVQWLLPQ